MDIAEALRAERGLVCVVGAGGKKTTLYTLAARVSRAVVTATVRIPVFDGQVARVVTTDDPVEAVRATDRWPVGVVPGREREDRYAGYDPATVADVADAGVADVVLVKADGARTRWLKAPAEHEPRLPASADVVVPVASARVVGRPLTDEYVHRVDRVAAATGLERGDEIRPEHVAAVLTSADGGLKDLPSGTTAVPLVNMVDDADLEATARAVAEEVLARGPVSRVVLARMLADEPLVGVVE